MVHDSTPHRIFKISELTRLIASHLVFFSRKSAVNLACACRYLEEPVLSTLWETQQTLNNLLKVVPGGTWHFGGPALAGTIVRGLDLPVEKSNT